MAASPTLCIYSTNSVYIKPQFTIQWFCAILHQALTQLKIKSTNSETDRCKEDQNSNTIIDKQYISPIQDISD